MSKTVIGRVASSDSIVEVRFGRAIEGADDLIHPPATNAFLAPGFIDLQVNGFAGVDYNDPTVSVEDIARSVRAMFSTGVTRCLPTIITGTADRMLACVRNVARAKKVLLTDNRPEGEALFGFHIEGPHICPDDGPRGAHPRDAVRPPDTAEFDRWQEACDGEIRIVTVSPEWDSAPEYIQHIVRQSTVASIGHTKATSDQIAAAIDAGATMSTHLGNATHPSLPKSGNYLFDQLVADRLGASLIVDGIHISREFLEIAVRCKGLDRSCLVTDAVMPAMCEPGFYELGSVAVELKPEGKVVLRGGDRLAGSALRMDVAIGNTVRLAGITLAQALVLATTNAARIGRVGGRQRGLVPGEKADLVLFDWDSQLARLTVKQTIVGGQIAYEAN